MEDDNLPKYYTVTVQKDGENIENIRVFTTAQLGKIFEVNRLLINRNFQRNRARFVEDEDFFFLKDDALKTFRISLGNPKSLLSTSKLYLWTEQGSKKLARLSKSEKAGEYLMNGLVE